MLNRDEVARVDKVKKQQPFLIPFPPDLVDIKDIQANGFLLSDDDRKFVEEFLKKNKFTEEKISKKKIFPHDFENKFSIIVAKDPSGTENTYIVYKGEKANKTLGEGSSGVVKLAQNLKTGEWVALKIITAKGSTVENKPSDSLAKELAEMKETKAINYGDTVNELSIENEKEEEVKPGTASLEFQEYELLKRFGSAKGFIVRNSPKGKQECIMMHLAPGVTLKKLLEEQSLSSQECLTLIAKVLEAVSLFHQKQAIHRDLKINNIVVDMKTLTVTIIDVGDTILLPENLSSVKDTAHGTMGFAPPSIEVYLNLIFHGLYPKSKTQVEYSHKTDIYAVGKIIEQLISAVKKEDKNATIVNIEKSLNTFLKDNQYIDKYLQQLDDAKDEETQENIFAELKKADQQNKDNIPSADEMLKQFFPNENLKTSKKTIGILNCNLSTYYIEATRKTVSQKLKGYDEIQLLNDDPTIPFEKLIEIKQKLEKNGVKVNSQILIAPKDSRAEENLTWLQKNALEKNSSYQVIPESMSRIAKQTAAYFSDAKKSTTFNPMKQEDYGVKNKIQMFQEKINTEKEKPSTQVPTIKSPKIKK